MKYWRKLRIRFVALVMLLVFILLSISACEDGENEASSIGWMTSVRDPVATDKQAEVILPVDTVSFDKEAMSAGEDYPLDERFLVFEEYPVRLQGRGPIHRVVAYVNGYIGEDGEVKLDHGHRWAVVLHTEQEHYVLYQGFISHGYLQVIPYSPLGEEDEMQIIVQVVADPGLTMYLCRYKQERMERELLWSTEGQVSHIPGTH